MPNRRYSILLLTCLMLWMCAIVSAQDEDKPLALLRRTPDTDEHFIRVQANTKLKPPSKVSAILTNKTSLVSWEEDVADCVGKLVGKFCKETDGAGFLIIKYHLVQAPSPTDKFKASFAITDETGSGSLRSVDVAPDFKVGSPRIDDLCSNGLIVDILADNPNLKIDPAEKNYYNARLVALDTWLKSNKSRPANIARVRIEPLTEANVAEYAIRTFTVVPAVDGAGHERDLDVSRALGSQKASICLQFEQSLPTGKFNAEVSFLNRPPFELEKPLVKALTGLKAIASPTASQVQDANKLGLRALENNLELGIVFTSSVKDVKKDNQTKRERQSLGVFDVRFAPELKGRLRPPEVKKWQPFWTPFFLDAKVSTGKISEDSLSLNRILFGTDIAFRNVRGTKQGERDKYVVTLRGTNASDRDFKLAEVKGEFEFRPIFEVLNQPLKIRHRTVTSALIPDNPPKEISSGGFFGYQVQPFIGVEAGRVYRRSRTTFKGDEQSDNLRRLLFGVDMAFNLSTRFNVTLTDIFYLRGETPADRGRNYFTGTIEVPLGNFTRNASQSIFFSIERGGQPPFATLDVNALKFGYRVRSDFFERGPSR